MKALAPLSDDDVCDLGGQGEGGSAFRSWDNQGLLPGGIEGAVAFGAAAVEAERSLWRRGRRGRAE